MEAPLLNQIERKILINHPKSPIADRYRFYLARKKFERDLVKSLYIPQIADWLSKQLNELKLNEKS